MKRKLILATRNKGKLKEIQVLLSDLDIDIMSLDEAENTPHVVEDGKTFMENAFKKAKVIAEATGIMALADDSGLEVDALDGAPGVHSARYSGENASDASNNEKLLADLKGVPSGKRGAHFSCVIIVYHPSGRWISTEAGCEGEIATNPSGDQGFGYDPVFYIPSIKRTMAQLSPEEKNSLSHRGKALEKLKAELSGFLVQL
ncbi:MAG: non-canonical purine NTP pyrophosphatase [Deltaproteobacteria bacterium]|nr:MAG: non-canonical purine NTP pyrophosphatase [Deltaproteobacteria bacterium]